MTEESGAGGDILLRVEGGVARITLNRPDAGNALTTDQRLCVFDWLDRANEDPSIRCVVIGSTGRFFCTGADLRGGSATAPPPRPEGAPERIVGDLRRNMLRSAIRLMNSILDCEKPVIASVQGTAAGIGAHLAFCCDLVVASEDAKFIEIFARRGLTA